MRTIVVPEDELQRLERRFGPDVRRMGPWNSDGVFGYASISLGAVESAASCKVAMARGSGVASAA